MSFGEGYDAAMKGMLIALKTAEELGAAKERQRILDMLLAIQQNWQHRPVLNFKTELFKIILLIEETK
jgi:hypothetical protein